MRPQLEAKKVSKNKMRLLLQEFEEPPEWDEDSNASPVAKGWVPMVQIRGH